MNNSTRRPILRNELNSLVHREAEEAERRESGRDEMRSQLQEAEAKASDLAEQLARARLKVEQLRERLEAEGREGPQDVRQHRQDRMGVLGRVLEADRYELDEVVDLFDSYRARLEGFRTKQEEDPSLGQDRELVVELERDDALLAGLPEAVRSVVLERAAEARERLSGFDVPAAPDASACIYAAEGVTEDGRYIYLVAVPAAVDAESPDHPHSLLLANVIAATCKAVRHRPDVDAPTLAAIPDRSHGLIVSMADAMLPEDDRGLFALRVEEELSTDDFPYALRVEAIDDALLKQGLSEVARHLLTEGGF